MLRRLDIRNDREAQDAGADCIADFHHRSEFHHLSVGFEVIPSDLEQGCEVGSRGLRKVCDLPTVDCISIEGCLLGLGKRSS